MWTSELLPIKHSAHIATRQKLPHNFFLAADHPIYNRAPPQAARMADNESNMSTGFTSVNAPAAVPATPIVRPPVAADTTEPAPSAAESAFPTPAHSVNTGTKRKRDATSKFYAVRVGKVPGIYHTWAECLDNVRGHPKAMFKSFTTISDAQQFVDGDSTAGAGDAKPTKWYGVRSGRVPGVYTSWHDVLDQITGWKGPKHKAFKTRVEAEEYVDETISTQLGPPNGYTYGAAESIEGYYEDGTPAGKKAKTSKSKKIEIKDENTSPRLAPYDEGEYEPGEAPLPANTEDGFDSALILDRETGRLRYKTAAERTATRFVATVPAPLAPVRIYTDGSSLANGQATAIGGIGVYFGPADKRNLSEPLPGTRQTNQRAELTAVLRALEVAPRDRRLVILTDSKYAISCITEWFVNWRKNGWTNASRKPVENKDLVSKLVDMLEERIRMNAHRHFEDDDVEGGERGCWDRGAGGVKFTWIKGHAKDEGNEAADGLATQAARDAKELMSDVVLD